MTKARRTSNFTDLPLGAAGEDGGSAQLHQEPGVDPATPGDFLPPASGDDAELPGFSVSDEPFSDPAVPSAIEKPSQLTAGLPLDGDILPPVPRPGTNSGGAKHITRDGQSNTIRYEGRIQILDAFQYAGSLEKAPPWVDRNWLGWGDHDPLRGISAGPCLNVPLVSGAVAKCRVGDYVVKQSVAFMPGMPGEERVEVWPKDDFTKNFMPVAA